MGLNLEWKRFTTWNMTDYMKAEIAILKERTPQIPVTTNFMKEYDGLDYHKMQQPLTWCPGILIRGFTMMRSRFQIR